VHIHSFPTASVSWHGRSHPLNENGTISHWLSR
jgi:hypothetical protein